MWMIIPLTDEVSHNFTFSEKEQLFGLAAVKKMEEKFQVHIINLPRF